MLLGKLPCIQFINDIAIQGWFLLFQMIAPLPNNEKANVD